jgi:glycosyltransferase involved in cell wall biosynthesis
VQGGVVTAFMPVYNGEVYLEQSLESLLAQDYDQLEVVVCDDGSTDRTAEILASYPTIRTVHQENRGRAAACAAAIEVSTGEFLSAFDADDLWPQNRLTLQATYLLEHPEVGCVLGRQEWMNPPPWLGRDPVYGDLDGVPIGSAMFARSVYEEVGGFDPSFRHSEDMDLLFRMREHGIGIAILPETVLYRRYHGQQMTANPPAAPPVLRALRQKIERERQASKGTEEPSCPGP